MHEYSRNLGTPPRDVHGVVARRRVTARARRSPCDVDSLQLLRHRLLPSLRLRAAHGVTDGHALTTKNRPRHLRGISVRPFNSKPPSPSSPRPCTWAAFLVILPALVSCEEDDPCQRCLPHEECVNDQGDPWQPGDYYTYCRAVYCDTDLDCFTGDLLACQDRTPCLIGCENYLGYCCTYCRLDHTCATENTSYCCQDPSGHFPAHRGPFCRGWCNYRASPPDALEPGSLVGTCMPEGTHCYLDADCDPGWRCNDSHQCRQPCAPEGACRCTSQYHYYDSTSHIDYCRNGLWEISQTCEPLGCRIEGPWLICNGGGGEDPGCLCEDC